MPRIANATNNSKKVRGIEVTPEMIEAGKVAPAAYRPYFDLEEDAVITICRAMVIARRAEK